MSPDVLLHENETLRSQLAARESAIVENEALIAELKSQVELLARKLKLTAHEHLLLQKRLKELLALRARHAVLAPGQGVLDFDGVGADSEPQPEHVGEAPDGETAQDPIRARHKPKQPAKKLDTSNLPVEHRHRELSPELRVCAITGKTLVAVGEKIEEEIEFQPGFLKLIVHHCAIYGLDEEDRRERQALEVVTPGPTRPLAGSVAGAGLLAWILVQKYGRHLPLYRQEEILKQHGLRIPRQTTCDWVLASAQQLAPIQEALRRSILATKLVQTDDTTVKCQAGKGQGFFRAHLWTTTSPLAEGVLYDFSETRGHEHLLAMFAGFNEGVLLGDGYAGYQSFATARPGVRIAGCWVHGLRKFRDALEEAPLLAAAAMTHIGKLFDIEKRARDEKLSPEDHLALRKRESAQALADLERELLGWREAYLESGALGGAAKYMETQHASLRVFLDDVRVPLHNNACEVAIRPVAVGRKNWLFAGSARGGRAAATVYTLVRSCKNADVDPLAYLTDVLVRVATHPAARVDELIPSNWKRIFGAAAGVDG